mgnify:FL=1
MAKLVSKVYGDALFETAMEKQEIDQLYEQVKLLKKIWNDNKDLAELLDNPRIVKEEKIQTIKNIFSGRFCDDLSGFLTVIVDKGRQKEIPAICDYFIGIVREYKRMGVAWITSAVELRDSQKEAIEKKLLDTTDYVGFEMNYKVEPEIIAGLIIRIGDRIVDSSVRTQLENLRRQLSGLQLS